MRGGARERLAYGPSRWQYAELWRPAAAPADGSPLVVLFHGGYWRAIFTRRLMDRLAGDLVARGWAVLNVEYRRLGMGGGGGGWPATFDDAQCALRLVRDLHGVDRERVVTCGHSVGAHLALWTAAASAREHDGFVAPALAVALGGVVDLVGAERLELGRGAVRRVLGGGPDEHPDRYRRVSLLDQLPLGIPQVLVHGTHDDVVPSQMSEDYARRATVSGDFAECRLIEGANHMSMIDPRSPAWASAVAAIEGVAP